MEKKKKRKRTLRQIFRRNQALEVKEELLQDRQNPEIDDRVENLQSHQLDVEDRHVSDSFEKPVSLQPLFRVLLVLFQGFAQVFGVVGPAVHQAVQGNQELGNIVLGAEIPKGDQAEDDLQNCFDVVVMVLIFFRAHQHSFFRKESGDPIFEGGDKVKALSGQAAAGELYYLSSLLGCFLGCECYLRERSMEIFSESRSWISSQTWPI